MSGPWGAAVTGPHASPDLLARLERALLQDTSPPDTSPPDTSPPDASLMSSLRRLAPGDQPELGIVMRTGNGFTVRVGANLQLRTDHVGFRTLHAGPCELLVRRSTRLAIVPPSAPWSGSLGSGPLPTRAAGAGLWLATATALGVPSRLNAGIGCDICGAWVHLRALVCPSCDGVLAPPRRREHQPPVPVATLVRDDGSSAALVGTVVIGREPHHDARVRSGTAEPLMLSDTERTVSRVHASLHVDGWDVLLEDHSSANGTAIRPASTAERVRLQPGVPVRVLPGTEITLGRRTLQLSL